LKEPPVQPHDTIDRLGPGVYRPPGTAFPFRVSDVEDWVLLSFVGRPAMTLAELVDRSGVVHAHKVVRALETKYGGAFAPAIRRPGRRGAGGYAVLVRDLAPGPVHKRATSRPATPAAAREQ
jgi:hypothetical protein